MGNKMLKVDTYQLSIRAVDSVRVSSGFFLLFCFRPGSYPRVMEAVGYQHAENHDGRPNWRPPARLEPRLVLPTVPRLEARGECEHDISSEQLYNFRLFYCTLKLST